MSVQLIIQCTQHKCRILVPFEVCITLTKLSSFSRARHDFPKTFELRTCVSVCISLYQCVSVSISVYQFISVCIGLYQFVSVCIGLYQFVSVCISVYQCVSVCISVYQFPVQNKADALSILISTQPPNIMNVHTSSHNVPAFRDRF